MPSDDLSLSVAGTSTVLPQPAKEFVKRWFSALLVVGCLTIASAVYVVHSISSSDPPPALPPKGDGVHLSEKGLNAEAFAHWPKDQKPEFVLVITAEMNGFMQKCGCSDPQKGGLERRWNLIEWLKNERGYEVLPLDLGDMTRPLRNNPDTHVPINHDQVVHKYTTTMRILNKMGYKAVGVGLEEFSLPLERAISAYSLQDGNEYPRLLAANITGAMLGNNFVKRPDAFPNGKNESAIRDWEVFPAGKMQVGVIGLVGDPIVRHVLGLPIEDANGKPVKDANGFEMQGLKIDPSICFAPNFGKKEPGPNSGKLVLEGLGDMAKLPKGKKPDLNVMLFQGPDDFARKVAGYFSTKPNHFDVIVCRTQQSEPPTRANEKVMIGKNTLLVQVGHKGQQVGIVGVFKKPDGSLDLQYQRIVLDDGFETPAGKEKQNLALAELEQYAKIVKLNEYQTKFPRSPHPLQVAQPQGSKVKYEYVGSAACQKCHVAEWNIHAGVKHGNAFAALVGATKPGLRQFDGECVVCHTVGFRYNTGYMDQRVVDAKNFAQRNALLINNGCENCHGPGNNHILTAPLPGTPYPNEEAAKFGAEMTPWKRPGDQHLPTVKQLTENAPLTQAEKNLLFRVDQICQQCHTPETDPHFQFEKYWPKIAHGNKQVPIAPAVPVKEGGVPALPVKNPR